MTKKITDLTCFKAYDIRGQLGTQIDNDVAYRIGRAYAQWLKPKTVVVGGDVRVTSSALKMALTEGLRDEGVDVFDIGLCGTEEVYFATFHGKYDGGIVVTASHNPIDYNGMKLVREDSRPISADTGLKDIRALAEADNFGPVKKKGEFKKVTHFDAYLQHLIGYVDVSALKPLKVVVNAGNGAAGPVIDGLENLLPIEFIKVNHEADGSFPNGIPNPLLIENRHHTADAVVKHGADLGIAWDGDFDRCFLFDEHGEFIEGYYIVGLLAEAFLKKEKGGKVIHDPRLTWNTIDICETAGGSALQSKCGHAFIKEIMREQDAIYGGEMSAHHYFRDFAYCDSGMVPWLLIVELLSKKGISLSDELGTRSQQYPCSGEINSEIQDPAAALAKVEAEFASSAIAIDRIDGISMTFAEGWRFNLRMSNTEPVVRLNVESKGDEALMKEKTAVLLGLLKG